MVSELSMNQANAMKLQQTVKQQEQLLEQAYIRMERGEAPTDDAEKEWQRIMREELRRQMEMQETRQVGWLVEHSCRTVPCRKTFIG